MILQIYIMATEENIYVAIPNRWAALEDEAFLWYFDRDLMVDNLYEERNKIMDEYFETDDWIIEDYGNADHFIHLGKDLNIQHIFT